MQMKFCPNCGKQTDDAHPFCSSCGYRFSAAAPSNNAYAYQTPPTTEYAQAPVKSKKISGKLMLSAYFLFRCFGQLAHVDPFDGV